MQILSTWLDGGYKKLSGTSMAAPHVTGTAALYIARHGGSPEEVKKAVIKAAKPADDSSWGYSGGSGDDVDDPVLYVGGF